MWKPACHRRLRRRNILTSPNGPYLQRMASRAFEAATESPAQLVPQASPIPAADINLKTAVERRESSATRHGVDLSDVCKAHNGLLVNPEELLRIQLTFKFLERL